ncbi:MAG: ribonuclease HI family protein [Patescibacteria group bacterium]
MTNDSISIFTDGGSRGNPGPAASAFIIYDSSNTTLHQHGFYLGIATNNQAEYQAVIEALKYIRDTLYEIHNTNFYLDSELVVKQLRGEYKIKDPNLQTKSQEIKNIIFLLPSNSVRFTHVPREQNSAADALVNKTLDSLSS